MSPEQLLLAAVSSITAALLWCVSRLWSKAETCEKDRNIMGQKLFDQNKELGVLKGTLEVMRECSEPGCPFRRTMRHYHESQEAK